jgi:hypothetical protein
MRTGKGKLAVPKISRTGILKTGLKIYIDTLGQHINFRGKKKRKLDPFPNCFFRKPDPTGIITKM